MAGRLVREGGLKNDDLSIEFSSEISHEICIGMLDLNFVPLCNKSTIFAQGSIGVPLCICLD